MKTEHIKTEYIKTIVHLALAEDLGEGDITSDNLIPAKARSKARLIAKADGIICGIDLAREVFKTLDSKITFRSSTHDGKKIRRGDVIAEIAGSTRALLSGERVAINMLSYLSAIATQTRRYVEQVKPYKADIMDTRKTTPLLRQLERYAVRAGGGVNHRFNLNDMAMIKDNHLIACKGKPLAEVINDLKKKIKAKVITEVDTFEQLKDVLHSKTDVILLDNMTPAEVSRAVKLRNKVQSRVLLESSGGITLKNIKRYAATGVDRISIGSLTHSRQTLDISMEFISNL